MPSSDPPKNAVINGGEGESIIYQQHRSAGGGLAGVEEKERGGGLLLYNEPSEGCTLTRNISIYRSIETPRGQNTFFQTKKLFQKCLKWR